jgi:hypothetical protein
VSGAAANAPVVVSFFSGASYYRQAAHLLRADCDRLGLDSDIVELAATGASTWIATCRRKVSFYLEMHRKHRRPILWLDVDSRIAQLPAALNAATCDIAGFLRGFRYLRDFDPLAVPRFFAPFALYFNAVPQVTAFLQLMVRLESQLSAAATDDFFLQEAWLQHQEQLAVMILPPDLLGDEWPLRDRQCIQVGISGNASRFKAEARQHIASMFAPSRRKAVLLREADALRGAGNVQDALTLYRLALAADPADSALAGKIERLHRRHGLVSKHPVSSLDGR